MNTIIVTGASDNHFKSLMQFLNSCSNKSITHIYVYDLGLSSININTLKNTYNFIILEKFDYTKYPNYFNISINAGEYAWKPAIIHEIMKKYEDNFNDCVLLWCDAGNILPSNITDIFNCIKNNGIYSPISSGTILQWTYPKMLEWFNILNDISYLNLDHRNGAILGFNLEDINVRNFINTFFNNACIKECIAPEGSNRSNHRQDQALFTILYYQFFKRNTTYNIINSYLNIVIHRDID